MAQAPSGRPTKKKDDYFHYALEKGNLDLPYMATSGGASMTVSASKQEKRKKKSSRRKSR